MSLRLNKWLAVSFLVVSTLALAQAPNPAPAPVYLRAKYAGKPLHFSWFNGPICDNNPKVQKGIEPCAISIELWDMTTDKRVVLLQAESTRDGHPQKWSGGDASHQYKARTIGRDIYGKPSESYWIISQVYFPE